MHAIVIGATGGIGGAVADALEARRDSVLRLSRRSEIPLDLTDEASIVSAAASLSDSPAADLLFVATGMLHTPSSGPEKSWRQLDAAKLAESFAINAIGPALVARHFLPRLAPSATLAFLSARVGSISDNRLGGWYGYRASKAALNMLVKTLAIELARSRPDAFCAALHPGTVDTALSQPFQRGVSPERLFTPDLAAQHLLKVLDRLGPTDSGRCFAWDGSTVAP